MNAVQYTDMLGITYVSVDPKAADVESWIDTMIEQYGLDTLTDWYPYQTLVQDEKGELKTVNECPYNALVTNYFHLRRAVEIDQLHKDMWANSDRVIPLQLSRHYPEKDEPEVREYGLPKAEEMILGENEGYGINYEAMPESVDIKMPPKGWHPNKDANGNYMANPSTYQWQNPYVGTPWGTSSWEIPNYYGYPF